MPTKNLTGGNQDQASVDQSRDQTGLPPEFIFNVALSTAIAADGQSQQKALVPTGPLTPDLLEKMNRYWRATNYLCIGQIYLFENPLLREPLKAEQIKPRLLGHWGTSPGQNLIYIHLNRLIKEHNANIIYIAGPGHGGPSLNANSYLREATVKSTQRSHWMKTVCVCCLEIFRHREAFPAIVDRMFQTRCTKAVNWATHWFMLSARRSIIQT